MRTSSSLAIAKQSRSWVERVPAVAGLGEMVLQRFRHGPRNRRVLAAAALFALSSTGAAEAANFSCAWNDGSGNWSTTADWSTCNGTFPNNGADTFDATINQGAGTVVIVDTAVAIDNLTIGAGNTVSVANGELLSLGNGGATTVSNAGALELSSTGSFTDLRLSGAVTMTGGGTFTLSNSFNNRVYASGGDTLTNDVGNTIEGAGQLGINNAGFGFTLDNKGTIDANQSGALEVAPTNTVTNTGTMEATNGGTLGLLGSFNNGGGLIQANGAGSVVELSGASITGGNLTSAAGGAVQNSGTATLDSVTITAGSTFTAVNGSATTLLNTITIAPSAALVVDSTGSFTDLRLSGSVLLTGGGTLTMSNSPNNRVFASGADTLTNDAGNTIEGAGQLGINNAGFGFTLDNKGLIDANAAGGTLQVAPSGTTTNTSTMEATNGGTLALIGSFTNTGALIQATGANSVVELSGASITGGDLTSAAGGAVQNSGTATLDGVTITAGSTFTAVNASATTLLNTITIAPSAALVVDSTGSFTDLRLSGSVLLTGGGTLTMSNSPNNRVFASGADTLTNDAGNTIEGAGQLGINNAGFGFTLNNNGLIDANAAGGTLQVAPSGTTTNTSTMEATNGGTLALIGSITNTGALIQATGANSVVELSGASITGGDLTSAAGGAVQNSGTATLDGVTITAGSTFTAVNASATTLLDTITIAPSAALVVDSTGSFTDLRLSGSVLLTGGGTLTMSNSPNNRVFASGGDTLTNDTNNTIEGAGQIGINNAGFGFTLNNNGTINANAAGDTLQVAPSGTTTNTGTMEATNGGTLALIGSFTNTGALIQATGANSVVELNGATITGGNLTSAAGGAVQNSGTATLDSVTITAGSTFTAVNASATTLLNTITIAPTATLAVNSTGSFTDIHVSGSVLLTGGGTLAMSNSPNNRVFATGVDTFTNDANNTIEGAGQIGINNAGFGFTLNNNGLINANAAGGTLQVAPSNTTTNTGTMEATNGGTLALIGSFTNTGALIQATGANSVVELNGATITGGNLTTAAGGAMQNSGTATLDGVTITDGSTVTAVNATSTTLLNTITIAPTATLALSSTGSFTDLHVSGSVLLTGGGTFAMSDSPNNRVFATGADSLTNDTNNTIAGAGQLGINNAGFAFTLTNNGTIDANLFGSTLQVAPSNNVTNNGTMQATNGGTLVMTGGVFTNNGTIQANADSAVDATGATLTNYDSGTSTLTGGTYNVFDNAFLALNVGASPLDIQTNAATILLSGANALILDQNFNDALANFASNTAAGNFTIMNGRNLNTPGDFSNAGNVTIGANSQFSANAGASNYTQTGGTTQVDGTLAATNVDIQGGMLKGTGTIAANLSNEGTVKPGDSPATLSVTGSYVQSAGGSFAVELGGTAPGQFGQLDVGGKATLNGDIALSLINGFLLSSGDSFDVMNAAQFNGDFSSLIFDGTTCTSGMRDVWNCSNLANMTIVERFDNGRMLDLVINGIPLPPPMPEPGTLVLLGSGLAVLFGRRQYGRR